MRVWWLFITNYDGTKYLVLFGSEKYDAFVIRLGIL